MKYNVKFINVGRNKKTWTKEYDTMPNDGALTREIKKQGALLSSGIDIEWVSDLKSASIWVGGFHKVGEIKIQQFQTEVA